MRVFVVRSDTAFTLLRPSREELWTWRGGAPITDDWKCPDLIVAEGGAGEFIAADCLELNSGTDGLILSDFALDRLDALLRPAGEFWPVKVVGRRYWWFNCLACVEALDRERTDADWSQVGGEWGSFRWITTTRRLAFDRDRVASAPALFRVPEYPQGVLFGTEALSGAVRESELTGFQFDSVWSAAEGGVADPPGVGLGGVFDAVDNEDVERRRADAMLVLRRREMSRGY